jgi:hypothetical protein
VQQENPGVRDPIGPLAARRQFVPFEAVGQTLPGGLQAHWVPPKGFFDASYIAFLPSEAYPGASALRSPIVAFVVMARLLVA